MAIKSIGVPEESHQKLKRFCERHGLGMGEYISASLAYFERHGINPATHESPAAEMNKLIKRLDQVIAFIRKQESDLLRPMVEAVSISEARIDKSLQETATASQVRQIGEAYSFLVDNLEKLIPAQQQEAAAARVSTERLLLEQNRKQLEALEVISQFLDKKDQGSFRSKVSSILK